LLKRQRVFEVSKAILHLTLAIHQRYQQLKKERAFLDYDSLITFTMAFFVRLKASFINWLMALITSLLMLPKIQVLISGG
jgi:hypothetical protein